MTVGALGEVVFSVSDKKIQTFQNLKRTASANIQIHKRLCRKSMLEFTGAEPEQITFSLELSKYLGSNIEAETERLFGYLNSGQAVRLVIGSRDYGRWAIRQISESCNSFSKSGTITGKRLDITLTEKAEV